MRLLDKPITKKELQQMAEKMFGNLVKAVVDIEREVAAIDAELHVDLAELLISQGSMNKNLWGVNIYPTAIPQRVASGSAEPSMRDTAEDDWLEFDSMINLKPQFDNRSRSVEDPVIREKITSILKKLINL